MKQSVLSLGDGQEEEEQIKGERSVVSNDQLRDLGRFKDHFGLENFLNIFRIFYTLSEVPE